MATTVGIRQFRAGLAEYLDSWQKVGPVESRKRAMRYLTAMPAWAHKAED